MQWAEDWRTAPLYKRPAAGSMGMVCTNHPIASAAVSYAISVVFTSYNLDTWTISECHGMLCRKGAEMLANGGNAIDAAVASLFCLSVVEPMMVGICGGGMVNIRLADGTVRDLAASSTKAPFDHAWCSVARWSASITTPRHQVLHTTASILQP
eukprot:SAG31_NODE_1383_length_8578_cov_3.660573_2_plen_154_part_00